MLRNLKLHLRSIIAVAIVATLVTAAMCTQGSIKSYVDWQWGDIFGEGISATLILSWFVLVLAARPRGRVTAALSLGLGSLFISMFVDTLDEIIEMPANALWYSIFESGASLTGLAFVTVGMYLWHREQLAINRIMQGRERGTRDHTQLDALTPLHRAAYFRQQALAFVQTLRMHGGECTLLAIDVVGFRAVNARYGFEEGDRALQTVGQILALNLRDGDLLCREAGDRFSVMLPHTSQEQATEISRSLHDAVSASTVWTQDGQRIEIELRVRATPLTRDCDDESVASLHHRDSPTAKVSA